MRDDILLAANHHAVAAFESPDSAARAHIHIMDALGLELLGPTDIVHVIGVAAVDEDVSRLKRRQNVGDGLIYHGRRDHQPQRPGLLKLGHQIRKRGASRRLLLHQLVDRFWRPVEHDALMPSLEEAPHHVRSHSSKTNHSKLHSRSFSGIVLRSRS